MISKKATIFAILLVGLLAVGIASAADDSTTDVASVESTIDDAISVESDGADDILGAYDTADTADVNGTDVLSIDESTSTVNEKPALDYSSDASAVASDSNVIENDKEILKSPNSEDDVLCGSMKTFDYDPDEISIGDTIFIKYEAPKDLSGDINITLGDYSQVYENYPYNGTVLFTYKGTKMGELEGVFTFKDVNGENSTKIFQVKINAKSTEINVTNSTLDLKVNDEVETGATLTPADAGNLTYRSSNSSVAVVENGKIKALANGTAIITVSFAGNSQYKPAENKTITVTVSLNDASVSVNNSTLDLMFGDNFTVVATTNPKDLPVNFTSSNSSVVTVDADGKIVAVGVGNAVITVSVGGNGVYALNSTTVNVNVGKKNLNISAFTFSMSGNVTIFVTGFENATGNVTVTIGKKIYNSSINRTMVMVSIPPLDKDITAYIYYPGDDNYCNASTTVDLIVKKNLNITVSVNPIHVGENATIIITGLENATGNISVIAGRSFYNAPIVNGTATAIISGLNSTSTAYILFMGDDHYNMTFTNVTITVLPARENVTISADPVTATYNINKNLVITLKDASGKVLSGVNVTVDLNGVKIYVSDENGQVKVNVAKLVPNKYTAVITFNGDDVYFNSTKNVQVTVKKAKAKIKAKNKTFKSNKKVKKYKITLKDQKGKAIKKVKVTLKIKGKKLIKAKTNSKGKATFKIKNLKKTGKHKAKIKFNGNNYYKKATKKVKIKVK